MAFNYKRLLKMGMTGEDVRSLQHSLQQLGHSPGAADGIFGSRTQSAVIAFQNSNNLAPDGIVGPKTATAINKRLTGGPIYLKLGSRGSDVKKLQTDLQNLGYEPGPIDGIFGTQTREAVIAFQRDMDLTPDGISRT